MEDKPIWLGHGSELPPSLNKGSLKKQYPVKSLFNQECSHFVLNNSLISLKSVISTKIGKVQPKIEGLGDLNEKEKTN